MNRLNHSTALGSSTLAMTLLFNVCLLRGQDAEVQAVEELKPQASARGSDRSQPSQFLRLNVVDQQPRSLDTAVVTYQSALLDGVQVDLIGAVHIGESNYYHELNKLFDSYDVLLYELVAADGTVIPPGGKRDGPTNPIAMLQDTAKNMLGLDSQLEKVDYSKPHFVRADMTPEQIAEKMAERGDTALTLALSTFVDVMRQQNLAAQRDQVAQLASLEDVSLADLLGNPLKMKRVLAEQFASTGSLDGALGSALNQLLIIDRNAEALRGLQKQIAQGKKKIGIFYGAAHLPDFERHLIDDFGLHKAKPASWLVAWDLTRAKPPELSEPASLLLNLLKRFGQ